MASAEALEDKAMRDLDRGPRYVLRAKWLGAILIMLSFVLFRYTADVIGYLLNDQMVGTWREFAEAMLWKELAEAILVHPPASLVIYSCIACILIECWPEKKKIFIAQAIAIISLFCLGHLLSAKGEADIPFELSAMSFSYYSLIALGSVFYFSLRTTSFRVIKRQAFGGLLGVFRYCVSWDLMTASIDHGGIEAEKLLAVLDLMSALVLYPALLVVGLAAGRLTARLGSA